VPRVGDISWIREERQPFTSSAEVGLAFSRDIPVVTQLISPAPSFGGAESVAFVRSVDRPN